MLCEDCGFPLSAAELSEFHEAAKYCTPRPVCTSCYLKFLNINRHLNLTQMQEPIIIDQEHYGKLQVETQEKDVMIISNVTIHPRTGKQITQVIFIERDNIPRLLSAFQPS